MKKGISAIEIIIVIAISVVLAAIVFFSFTSLNSGQALEKDTLLVTAVLNEARSRTLSSKGASQYGIHIEEFRVVLFQGASYSSSDPENETSDLSSHTQISEITLSGGGNDIIFSRLTGEASKSGTLTLSLRNGGTNEKTITIYSTGVVQSN